MESKVKLPRQRVRVQTVVDPERKTKALQSEKKSADINNIVARAHKTGQLPVLVGRQPIQSLPSVSTYQEALNQVVHAREQFDRLPASIRNEFDNDPVKLLRALDNPQENLERLLKAKMLHPVKEKIDPIIASLQKIAENTAPKSPSEE